MESYFYSNIQLGWEKLNQYYKLTNDLTTYIASIALYLCYKWKFIKSQWANKPLQIKAAKQHIKRAWAPYKSLKIQKDIYSPPKKHLCLKKQGLKAFLDIGLSDKSEDNKIENKYKA